MDSEQDNLIQSKDSNLNLEEKESAAFKKILDEQEDSSLSSNEYGGSNEVVTRLFRKLYQFKHIC